MKRGYLYLIGALIAVALFAGGVAARPFIFPESPATIDSMVDSQVVKIDELSMDHGRVELFKTIAPDEPVGYLLRWMPDFTTTSFVTTVVMFTSKEENASIGDMLLYTDETGPHTYRFIVEGDKILMAQSITP